MATPHHNHHHHDQYVHDSEDTSDSNEEFASASEGDDDLPWEPVVIRSPIISRQSPISPALSSSQVQVETPRPAHAIATPTYATTTTGTTTITRSTSSSSSSVATTTTTTTSRTLAATTSSYEQQQQQQQQQQHQEQHDFDQGRQEHYHYQQQSHDASPHLHSHREQEQQWEQQQHHQQKQQQWTSTSVQLDASTPRTHHAHREFSSSSSSSMQSQGSPSQPPRGAAPKLRERMRQSPVLHSRIVQAYLDPNASQAQRQQQQHVSSENVRQAWLQDGHQESSEDDTEEEREQEHQHTSPIRSTPTRSHIPVFHHPVVPLPIQVAPVPSFEAPSPVDQHDTEQSWNEWNEDEYENQVHSDHHHQEETAWGFDDQIDIEGGAQPAEQQVEEAWGFDEPVDIEGGALPQVAEPAAETAWGIDDNINVEGGTHSGEQTEAAWGFDDDIQVEENVQDQPHTEPVQDLNSAHVKEEEQPRAYRDETAWGFDDNLHVQESMLPDLQQVEAAWGFDDNTDIEGGIQAEDLSPEPIAVVENTTQLVETAHPDQHQGESAWGMDDNIHIDETAQPGQHQAESAWGFDDTIDIVTTTATHEHQHLETTADVEVGASVDMSTTASNDHHVGASWGFEEKTEIGDTPQVEQIESAWGFDEPIAVDEHINDREVEQADNSIAAVEPICPTMHQAHENDADAWDYDDQVIELIEEAAVQEIHSGSFAADEHDDNLDRQDFQLSHAITTDDPFSEHVVMPPYSATPTADNYEDDQELAVVVDHTTVDGPRQLVQEHPPHADSTVSESDNHHNLYHAVLGDTHSAGSAGPSDVVEAAEAEQSWGFDMGEVIGDEDLESAALDNPSLSETVQEPYQHEEAHAVSSADDNTHNQVGQESFVASTIEATEDIEDIKAAVIADDTERSNQASDDENDSEVREVLFATQHTPVAIPEEDESSEISPFATNSRAHSGSSVSFDDSKPYYADAAVTSRLLVKEDAAPSHRPDSRGGIGELRRSTSDSEGSDIYGDLSTAYTGRNMSSNRLNEILDDDDYLEHMERGVPMDRSISTPFSDDETPKFIMEDDAVELMERGEPQSVGGAPTDHPETLDDEEYDSSDDIQATSSSAERAIDTSEVAAPSDLALSIPDGTVSQSLPDAIEETTTAPISHGVETSVVEKQVEALPVGDAKVAILEEEELATAVEAVVDAVSDDRDPANPFSDAAAIDDTDLWQATKPLFEKTEKEELLSEPLADAPSQDSTVDIQGLSPAIDEGVEDSWADQGLDVAFEPTVDISTPPTKHSIPEIHADVKSEAEETPTAADNISQDTIDDLGGDAWGDQDLDIADNSTLFQITEESKEAPVHHEVLPVVEHNERQLDNLEAPEQPLVESNVDVHETATQPDPFDDLKEEVADDDLSELPAVKEVAIEAQVSSPLLDIETSAVHVYETPASQHVDIPVTTPKETMLEVDAWDNQTDALGIDAALGEDTWADQEDAVPFDIPVVPVEPAAVVSQENSVSDLFADKSDQHYSKPSSPVRAFAFSPARADSPVRASVTSPVRGFSAFARSPTSPQERSVSDLFGDKAEKSYFKPTSSTRGFAAYAAYSHSDHQQERSVSDLFSDSPVQQSVKPSTPSPIPATAPVEDDLLKDAVEEDAWDDQDIHIDEGPLPVATKSELQPVATKSESEPEPEPESVTTAFGVEQTIDDIPEDDAWGEDQDIQFDQEPMPAEAEPHVETPAAAVDVQEVHEHITHTSGQTSESQSTQEMTCAFDFDQTIDAAIEDDVWDNQDDGMTFESILLSQQELEQEPQQEQHEPVHIPPETAPVEDLAQEDAHKHHEPTADALSIGHSLEAAIEEDAWDNQDDITFDQEFQTRQEHQPIKHSHESVHSEDVIAEDNCPIRDDIPDSPLAETQLIEHSPASNQPAEHEGQPILPSFESPALPTPTDAEVEFDLDKALEDDAWNDQDADLGLESTEPAHTTQDTHAATILESQNLDAKKPEERPSSTGSRIGSIDHQSHAKTAVEIVEDAWGWDEDEVGVDSEIQNDNEATTFAQDDQDKAEHIDTHSPIDAEEVTTVQGKATPDAHSPTQVLAETPSNNIPPLAIQKERLAAGADSGEGEADSATQSPWQDISPGSVSKRSEAGMSIGSEFESEYSVRSLDEDGHVSSAFDRHQPHGQDTSASLAESETKKALETTMSWTDLKDDDAWDDDLPEIGPINPPTDSKETSAPTKETGNSADAQQLPDISGADNWDFDQDDDIETESPSSYAGLTPASTRASFSRSLKTPDMTESRSFGSQPSPQNRTPTFSSITSSPGQVLSSYQSSVVGSIPASPSQVVEPAVPAAEIEDDSHLPLAIRQQRARLAARGKPLPPISKYKSTKEAAAEQQSSPVLSSASPRLAAAVAVVSPTISFASPAKTPVSPALNPTPAASDQKYLSPALQKQRERLEKKRAASAAAAAVPLSAVRRLVPSDSTLVSSSSSSSQVPIKPKSPLIKEAMLPSVLKHTLSSPTGVRKSVHLVDRTDTTTTTSSTFSTEEFGHSTRRRGLSVSSNQSAQATSPLTPTGDGVVRRSKEGNRPSMFSSFSAATTPTNATFSEMGESNVVKSTQNDAFRHVSRLSMSSSTAGSGWDDTPEEDVQKEEEKKSSKIESKVTGKVVDRKEAVSRPAMFSSTSSSSFYQQSVPGLDDDDDSFGEPSVKSTIDDGLSSFASNINTSTTTTSTTSSYLNSKKVDDYDPYGPKASHKAKSSFEDQDRDSYAEANEVLIGQSAPSHGVSLLSPTSATSMSHRHDPHHQHSSSSNKFGGGSSIKEVAHTSHTTTTNSSSSSSSSGGGGFGGGFFGGGGGGGSLVGDINSLLQEKKNPALTSSSTGFGSSSTSGANLGSDYEPKKPSAASGQPPSAVQQKQQGLPKSSGWSFGSWVSSAVAVATEKIDQAYETLDPEYSRMKARSPMTSNSTSFASDVGAEGSGDPDSLSPFKKPGYVVGGSSLALGLASISAPGSSGSAPGTGPSTPQAQAHRYGRSSSEAPLFAMSSSNNNNSKREEDSHVEESFASAGTESSDSYGHYAGHGGNAHHRASHNTSSERDQSLSPRLTRKNVR